jgi:hypothetical protein
MPSQNKGLKKLKAAELLRRCGEDEEAIQELLPLLNAADPKITRIKHGKGTTLN